MADQSSIEEGVRELRKARYKNSPFNTSTNPSVNVRRRQSLRDLVGKRPDLKPHVEAITQQADIKLQTTTRLVASVIIAMVCGFLLGYHTSVMNAAEATALPGHTVGGWSFAVTAMAVGGPIGSSIGGEFADQYGRQTSLLLIIAVFSAGGVVLTLGNAVLNSLAVVVGARFALGIAAGATTVVLPVYLGEIAPPELRGTFGTLNQLAMVLGILVADVMALVPALATANMMFGVSAAVAIVQLAAALALPLATSPRYLLSKDPGSADARVVISALYGLDSTMAEEEAELITGAHNHQFREREGNKVFDAPAAPADVAKPDDHTASGLFGDVAYKFLFFSVMALHVAQQLCGINAVFYYSTSFFVGVIDNPDVGTALVGLVNVVATLAATVVMDSSGRVMLLAVSALGMFGATVLITAALAGLVANTMALAGVLLFVAFFAFGLGPIPWMIVSEMYDTDHAIAAQARASQLNWMCNILVGLGFPMLQSSLGNFSFVPFGCVLLAALAFVLSTLPETHGRTPAEIHADLVRRCAPAQQAGKYGALSLQDP